MSESAKQRLEAIGKQLAPDGVPSIIQVAPASNGPKAQGKVVIITGRVHILSLSLSLSYYL